MKRTNAFTLMELLITLSVIAVLALLGMMTYGKVIAQSRSTKCVANLRTIITATLAYSHDNSGYLLPHNGYAFYETSGAERTRKTGWHWMTHLAPYLGAPDYSGPMSSVFNCPGDPEVKTWPPERPYLPATSGDKSHILCSYGYNYYYLSTTGSWWAEDATYPRNVKAITRPSILIVFTDGRVNPSNPIVNPFNVVAYPSLRHSDRFNAVFMDGHAESMDKDALKSSKPYWLPQ